MFTRHLMMQNAGVMMHDALLCCRSGWRGQSLSYPFCSSALRPSHPLGIMGVSVHPPHQWLAPASRDPREAAPPTETQSGALSPGICESTFHLLWMSVSRDLWRTLHVTLILTAAAPLNRFKWKQEGKRSSLVMVWQLSVYLCYLPHLSCQWHFPKISS